MEKIRILYIEQNKLAQMGMHELIRRQTGHFHISHYEFIQEVDLTQFFDAHVVLFSDYGLDFSEVYNNITAIRSNLPSIKIILIGYRTVAPYIYHLIELGINGFVFWDNMPDKLCVGIDAIVNDGVMCLCDRAAETIQNIQEWGIEERFSGNELMVLHKLSQGMTVQEIAICMKCSRDTIYNTRKRIKKKLGIRNTDTLIDVARRYHLLDSNE